MIDLQSLVRSLPDRPPAAWRQVLLALGCVGTAALARLGLGEALDGAPFITFFPAVLVAGVWGGAGAGLVALAVSTAVAEYLWVEPPHAAAPAGLGTATLATFLAAGGVVVLVGHLVQAAVARARAAEGRADLVAREMQHRMGNKLALIQSIARLSARHATTLPEFQEQFQARLRALTEAQSLSGPDPDLPTDLAALLHTVLRPFDEERIDIAGPPAGVHQNDRPMLALVLHELGTNAVKHGALSVPEGRVSITWAAARSGLRLDWRESGGPPVHPPTHAGFGTSLIGAAFPQQRGEVKVEYPAGGLRCTVTLHCGAPTAPPPPPAFPTAAAPARG